MSFDEVSSFAALAGVYSETTSLTVLILRVSVEKPLSSKAAFGIFGLLFPQWRLGSRPRL